MTAAPTDHVSIIGALASLRSGFASLASQTSHQRKTLIGSSGVADVRSQTALSRFMVSSVGSDHPTRAYREIGAHKRFCDAFQPDRNDGSQARRNSSADRPLYYPRSNRPAVTLDCLTVQGDPLGSRLSRRSVAKIYKDLQRGCKSFTWKITIRNACFSKIYKIYNFF